MSINSFGAKATLDVAGTTYEIFRLAAVEILVGHAVRIALGPRAHHLVHRSRMDGDARPDGP